MLLPSRYRRTLLCALLLVLSGSARPLETAPSLFDVHFGQKNWYDPYGTLYAPYSLWGYLRFQYLPPVDRTFFLNVVALLPGRLDGAWVVRNVPLFPSNLSPRSLGVDVDLAMLGLTSGTPISTIDLTLSIDASIRTSAPSAQPSQPYPVEILVQDDWSALPIAPQPFPDPGSPEGSILAAAPADKPEDRDIQPIQEDRLQCVPGAMARSLDWLNRTQKLGVNKSITDIYNELVKKINIKNAPNNFDAVTEQVKQKDAYTNAAFKNKIVTKVYDASGKLGKIPGVEKKTPADEPLDAWLDREIKTEDVELGTIRTSPGGTLLGLHIVTIVGIYKTNEPKLMVRYRDDEAQGDNTKGDKEPKEARLWFQDGRWRFVLFKTEVLLLVAESVRP
jgi:hypothetical protein